MEPFIQLCPGIGSAFGINVRSTSSDIERVAERFRAAVEQHVH